MDILGTWKIHKVGLFDMDEGMVLKTAEELMAMEENEDVLQAREMIAVSTLYVTEEAMELRMVMPQHAINEAEEAGEEIPFNEDGSVTVQAFPLKEENGTVFYNTGDEGSFDGEELNPWQPVELDEDGCFTVGFMSFKRA